MSLQPVWRRAAAGIIISAGAILSSAGMAAESQPPLPPPPQPLILPGPADVIASPQDFLTLVSFPYVLRTGNIPSRSDSSQYFEWESDDAFIRSFRGIRQKVYEAVEASPVTSKLLAKVFWDRADRVAWERALSEIVSAEMDKVKGLDEYRSYEFISADYAGPFADRRAERLNDLASDIEKGEHGIEFDCEAMSAFEGCLLQSAENGFLPADAPENSYRKAHPYYYANGWFGMYGDLKNSYAHAFIVSAATGNIIEATRDPSLDKASPYIESVRPDSSFESFMAEKKNFCKDSSLYGGYFQPGEVLQRRLDLSLQQAEEYMVCADECLILMPDDLQSATIRAIMSYSADHGFNDDARARMAASLKDPGMVEKWDMLLKEREVMLNTWSNMYDQTKDNSVLTQKIQEKINILRKSSIWGSCLPQQVSEFSAATFEMRLFLAETQMENFWRDLRAFAADPKMEEVAAIMGKVGAAAPEEQDNDRIAALLLEPDMAARWEDVIRRGDTMLQAWKSANQAGQTGTFEMELASYRRIHDKLEILVQAMPDEARLMPCDRNLETFHDNFNLRAGGYLQELKNFLELYEPKILRPDNRPPQKTPLIIAADLWMPILSN